MEQAKKNETVGQNLRVAFVINTFGAYDIQSIPQMAALARAGGHEVRLFEYRRNVPAALKGLQTYAPHLIAYSVCSNEAHDYLEINRELKARLQFLSVFGGPHPTFTPSMIREDGVDALCRGEGDIAFPRLLGAFGLPAMYDTGNFLFKMDDGSIRENPMLDLVADLDSVPFMARDVVYEQNYFMARNPIKAFGAGRGCPYACSYCFNNVYKRLYEGKGHMLRTKSVGYLIAEIGNVAAKYPVKFIRFYDDVFGHDLDWLDEFAERFPNDVGVPFTCYMRPNFVSDRYVALLKKAGCFAVYIAIESANEEIRTTVLNRRVTNGQIVQAVARIKQAGIRVFSFNMVGIPGETEEDMFETVRFNRRLGVDFADVSVFQPYPGTPSYDYCKERGLIAGESTRFESMYVASSLNISEAERQRIYVIHKFFTFLVDHPAADFLARHYPNWPRFNGTLNLVHKMYYGYFLHKRIYASTIPLGLRLRGLWNFLLSRNRV